ATRFRQVVYGVHVIFMGIDDCQLFEGKRMTAGVDQGAGFFVPEGFQVAVDFGEFGGQRGVYDDFEVVPRERLATGSVPLGTDPKRTKPGVSRWPLGGVSPLCSLPGLVVNYLFITKLGNQPF